MITELNEKLGEIEKPFLLYGILLFTEENPYVIKTLKDPDLYDAIDIISGDEIMVFAAMLFKGDSRHPTLPPGTLMRMNPIWVEPQENIKLLKWFDIKSSREFPLLVLFTYNMQPSQLLWQTYPIKESSTSDVFASIQQNLMLARKTIEKSEGKKRIEILKRLKWKTKSIRTLDKIKQVFNAIGTFRGITGI
jgi:hypothetical protein